MDTEFRWTGKPGELVPTVDPADVRSAWEAQREHEKRFPPSSFGLVAVAGGAPRYSEGADVRAVGYRMTLLKIWISHVPEMAAYVKDGLPDDIVFRAIAEIPMMWIGEKEHQGFPFDGEGLIESLRG